MSCQACGCTNSGCDKFVGETLDMEWWDSRFLEDIEEDTSSDWLIDFIGISHVILPYLNPSLHTLVVGCGNSGFSECLFVEASFESVVNSDLSPVVIKFMREKHKENTALTWVVDDATQMKFNDCSFDQIIDKSLLDCMCHCEDQEFAGSPNKYVRECFRVLRPGGVVIFVTNQNSKGT